MTAISLENPLTSKDAQELLAMLSARVEVERGMSEWELDHVEERWGFRFAPEHRTLLGAGLPTGSRSWPDWRDGDPEDLAEGELLRRAERGELSVRGPSGLRMSMPPLAPIAPFQHTAPAAS
jgi:hypothetical protein